MDFPACQRKRTLRDRDIVIRIRPGMPCSELAIAGSLSMQVT